jgi:hypothetical protein
LNRAASCSRLAATLAGFLALFASACAVPLAPGYRILKESRSVEFVPGETPELRIRADFMLENSGNSELTFVDVALPDEKVFGLTNPRAKVDGSETAFASLPADYQEEEPNSLRIPLDPPWKQKKTRGVEIEYTFRAPGDSEERITLGKDNFHLGPRGWFPLPQPPKHFLAPYPKRPDHMVYTVRIPEDFLILARGAPAGQKKDGGEVEYRFDLGKRDLTPYVVAGRYTASSARRNGAVFWTLKPLEGDPGPAEERITAAWSILEGDFGPLDKNIRAPHVVESPELRGESGAEAEAAIAAFPGGALVNGAALAQGIGSEEFLEAVAQALARGWFDDEIYPAPEAAVVMGEGLPEYATIAIEEARNGEPGRRRRILYYLEEYDKARKEAAEKPLGEAMASSPREQRRIALAKAPLFFAALEDACGHAQMQGGLKQLVALMGSREANIEDLRAELELSSGKDLAELVRVWLNEKGIPEEFRERYAMPKDGPTGN